MNQQVQGSSSSPADPPLKRKRGRPRKDESLVNVEIVPAIPAADNMKKNKECVGTTGDEMLGQVVFGVIEGSFDAGYLLKVKVGDTDTHLNGVVFLPGKFTPISASNDVAPQAKMYTRTEMPIPVLTQVPAPIPPLEQNDKQPVELQNLVLVPVQGLSSELQSIVPITQENQPARSMLPLIDNLPLSSIGSSFGGGQFVPVMPQMGHDKVSEQEEVHKAFEASITKVSDVNVGATEQLKSLPQSAPSVDSLAGTGTVDLELQIQHHAANNELKQNQELIHGAKSTSLEDNQVSVVTEPGIMSSEPIGLKIWMEKQASPEKATPPPELAMKIIDGNDSSHLNGGIVSQAANITKLDSQSIPTAMITGLPVTVFERKAILSVPTLSTQGSSPPKMIESELCSSSGTTYMAKENSDSAPTTNLPVTFFERSSISSAPKLAIDEPTLPRMTESLFGSSSSAANNVDCNLQDAISPTES